MASALPVRAAALVFLLNLGPQSALAANDDVKADFVGPCGEPGAYVCATFSGFANARDIRVMTVKAAKSGTAIVTYNGGFNCRPNAAGPAVRVRAEFQILGNEGVPGPGAGGVIYQQDITGFVNWPLNVTRYIKVAKGKRDVRARLYVDVPPTATCDLQGGHMGYVFVPD